MDRKVETGLRKRLRRGITLDRKQTACSDERAGDNRFALIERLGPNFLVILRGKKEDDDCPPLGRFPRQLFLARQVRYTPDAASQTELQKHLRPFSFDLLDPTWYFSSHKSHHWGAD